MPGFRSLGEGEPVVFWYKKADDGPQATFVCGPGMVECHGIAHRPKRNRKLRNPRFVLYTLLYYYFALT